MYGTCLCYKVCQCPGAVALSPPLPSASLIPGPAPSRAPGTTPSTASHPYLNLPPEAAEGPGEETDSDDPTASHKRARAEATAVPSSVSFEGDEETEEDEPPKRRSSGSSGHRAAGPGAPTRPLSSGAGMKGAKGGCRVWGATGANGGGGVGAAECGALVARGPPAAMGV
jgi:hypothetical protein